MGFTFKPNSVLKEIQTIEPDVYYDERGKFIETFRLDHFNEIDINVDIFQENESTSMKDVIRGMHFQYDEPQGKLLRVVSGKIILVEVDIRYNSPTFGKHCTIELDSSKSKMVWIPPGFANGFLSLEDNTRVLYKCTSKYNPNGETSIRWNDPDVGIDWINYLNGRKPILSKKDMEAPTLKDWVNNPHCKELSYE
jgi:dTDP-4-dehydrorhamnose 3,5-epimerase